MGRASLIIGAAIGISSAYLFYSGLGTEWVYTGLGALSIVSAVLSGRKMAALLHDAHGLKLRGRSFSVSGALSIIMFLFMAFILFLSIAITVAFRLAGLVSSALGAGFSNFLYSTGFLASSYLIFKYRYDKEPMELRSSWGRRAERSAAAIRSIPGNAVQSAENLAKKPGKLISRSVSAFSGNRGRP